jgi:hypothetical protein
MFFGICYYNNVQAASIRVLGEYTLPQGYSALGNTTFFNVKSPVTITSFARGLDEIIDEWGAVAVFVRKWKFIADASSKSGVEQSFAVTIPTVASNFFADSLYFININTENVSVNTGFPREQSISRLNIFRFGNNFGYFTSIWQVIRERQDMGWLYGWLINIDVNCWSFTNISQSKVDCNILSRTDVIEKIVERTDNFRLDLYPRSLIEFHNINLFLHNISLFFQNGDGFVSLSGGGAYILPLEIRDNCTYDCSKGENAGKNANVARPFRHHALMSIMTSFLFFVGLVISTKSIFKVTEFADDHNWKFWWLPGIFCLIIAFVFAYYFVMSLSSI